MDKLEQKIDHNKLIKERREENNGVASARYIEKVMKENKDKYQFLGGFIPSCECKCHIRY